MALRRIQKEAKDLEALRQSTNVTDAPLRQVVDVTVVNDDPHHWSVLVMPEGDQCESVALYGVEVRLDVVFPQDYPFKPPRIEFDAGWLQSIRRALTWTTAGASVGRVVAPAVPPLAAVTMTAAIAVAVTGQAARRALQSAESEARLGWERQWSDELHMLPFALDWFEGDARATLVRAEGQKREDIASQITTVRKLFVEPAPSNARLTSGESTVLVKTQSGKTIPVTVRTDITTVEQLKAAVMEKEGVPVASQRLIFAGRQLEDGRTLADYNVEHLMVVHLILRISGCSRSALGGHVILRDNWSPALSIIYLLRTMNHTLYVRTSQQGESETHDCGCHFRPLFELYPTMELVQWAARCCFPARNVVWSRDNDARWPLVFRKIVRYVRRIRVRPGTHATRATLPLDVVELIASFL